MGRIQPLERDQASLESQAVYDEIEAAFGMVPNLFKTYAHFPPLLEANWAKTKALMMGGRLPRPLKEMIAVVVSQANACRYCVAAHTMMLHHLGFPPERTQRLAEDIASAGLSETEQAVLALVRKSTTEPLSVTDGDLARLRERGLTDAEIVEAQGVMELFTGYNKFLDSLAVDIDF